MLHQDLLAQLNKKNYSQKCKSALISNVEEECHKGKRMSQIMSFLKGIAFVSTLSIVILEHLILYININIIITLLQGLLDTNPTRGFQLLLQLVSRDSSVLLDFLVSNETCFLLYLLRFLKFIVKVQHILLFVYQFRF